jgi:hypothetical protein
MNKKITQLIPFAIFIILLSLMRSDIFEWDFFKIPINDFSANDLLIQDAKYFKLWHGNYSRVGFYHPGPFYFQIMAFSEILFNDFLSLIDSHVASHVFGWLLYAASALAIFFNSLNLLLNSKIKASAALLAVVIISQLSIGAEEYYLNQFFILTPWPPFMYMVTMLIFISSLIYISNKQTMGIVYFIFSTLTLIHGHASFIGLVPIIIASTAIFFIFFGKRLIDLKSFFSIIVVDKLVIFTSLALITLFSLPIAADAFFNWPGQIPNYFSYAGNERKIYSPYEYLVYAQGFWHWSFMFGFIGLFIFFNKANSSLLNISALIIFSVLPAALFYLVKGLDTLAYRYPLFWIAPVLSTASVLSFIHFIDKMEMRFTNSVLMFLVFILIDAKNLGFKKLQEAIPGEDYHNIINKIKEESLNSQVIININKQDVFPVVMATSIISIDKRIGSKSFCVESKSWDIAYTVQYRCDGINGKYQKFIYLTKGDDYDHGQLMFSVGDLRGYILASIN